MMNSKLLYDRSLHESGTGFLPKRPSDHFGSQSIGGARVYPYPGTTQEPVRNTYHPHIPPPTPLTHHMLSPLYIGTNNNPNVVGAQTFREPSYQVQADRQHQEYQANFDRYRNRLEINEAHSSGSGTNQSSQIIRRRPSLLPHSLPNEYNVGSGSSFMNRIDRERYELYRYHYDRSNISHSPSITMGTIGHHGGPIHMIPHGYLSGGHHQSGGIVQSTHQLHDVSGELSGNKRPRLTIDTRASIHQPLVIDTRDNVEVKKEPAYAPQVEAISPTLPNEDNRQEMSPLRSSKDELLQNINKVDREICQTESQIMKLRKRQKELELATSKPASINKEIQENLSSESKQLSIAQIIYSENKKKSTQLQLQLEKFGPKCDLPLYNQPSDTNVYHENKRKFVIFKKRLILYFKKRYQEKHLRQRYLTETYDKLMMSWLKKLEKKETQPTKKTKDAKLREYFEKQFPELRKQREDRERFSRVGQRIRSDAELEEIMDGIQEQELEDKKMRSYAVIPPILLDSRLRKYRFINKNGLIEDCLTEYKEKQMLNVWTNQEKEIFRERFLQHPKNFGLIASYLERKTIADCVQYYYLSKKSENYKQLLRKHVKKRTRALVKAQQQQQQQAAQVNSKQNQEEQKFTSKVLSSNNNTTTTITTSTTTSTIVTTASVISLSSSSTTTTTTITTTTTTTNSAFSEVNCKTNTEKFVKTAPNNDNNLNINLIDENVPHKCCVCGEKVENSSKSKPVTLTNYQLYGLTNDNVKLGMRVCLMCHFKTVRRDCPIESCKTPRRKVKKLKLLPPQWFDLSSDQKMFFANDLNIPIDTKIACQRCVMRIARKLGAISFLKNNNIQYVNSEIKWDENEIESIKKGIKEYGKDWNAIVTLVNTKTIKECKEFYFNYKYVYDLDEFLREFKINNGDLVKSDESDSDEFWNEISDADSEETSSAEEGNERCTSDTASASSPMNKTEEKDFDLAKGVTEKSLNNSPNCKLQDYKVLSTSQGSLKSDYDSSATMSADEGQGNCENEGRISPSPSSSMHLPPRANSAMPVFPPSNNTIYQHQQSEKNARPASHDAAFAIDMVGKATHSTPILQGQKVPPFLIHPNAPQPVSVSHINNNKEEPTCVRDLIYQAIELSLQSPAKGGRASNVLGGDNDKHSNPDPELFTLPGIKREDLIDARKQSTSHDISHPFKNSDLPRPEGLAMVASYHPHQIIAPHSYNVDGDYEVQDLSKKDKRADDSSGRSYSVSQIKDKMGFIRNEQYSFVPPPAHSNQYRPNEKESKEMFSYPRQENKYMKVGYGYSERIGSRTPDLSQSDKNPTSSSFNRVTSKIPSTKSSTVPPPPPLIASGKAQQMSPNLAYRDKLVPVSTTGGSITHGTPIVPQQYGQGLLRQLPSLPPKESGSITLGTPLISGANESTKRKSDINDNSRGEVARPLQHMMYEHGMKQFYRGSSPTQSPYSAQFQHQGVYQPNLQAHIANQSNRTPFHKESQLSSNQLMIDFNTSKQMLTRRGSGSSEKDNRSSTPTQDGRMNPIDSKVITPSRHPLCVNYSPTAPGIPHSIYSERFQQSEAASSFINDKKQDSHLSPTNYHWSKQNPNLPISRQNVIQHWNAPTNSKQSVIQTPKSCSPRDIRGDEMAGQQSGKVSNLSNNLMFASHDAFTTLVNAAAAQQSLAVPGSERRVGIQSGRGDSRESSREKANVEGLEKSLMDMHHRPRNYPDASYQNLESSERSRMSEHKNDFPSHLGMPRPMQLIDSQRNSDELIMLEHKRRLEIAENQIAEFERQRKRALEEHSSTSLSTLRYPGMREPFSREQFERELRQQDSRQQDSRQHDSRQHDPRQHDSRQHDSRQHDSRHQDQTSRHSEFSNQKTTSDTHPDQRAELDNEASKLFSQSFQKDQKTPAARGFTAATLIDAIITHQINQSTDSNGKNLVQPQSSPSHSVSSSNVRNPSPSNGTIESIFNKYRPTEKPQHSNREEVVTIADSPDHLERTNANDYTIKNITLGEHINTIITKNYNNSSDTRPQYTHSIPHSLPVELRNNNFISHPIVSHETRPNVSTSGVLEGIAAAAVSNVSTENNPRQSPPQTSWKLRKALQQDKDVNKNTDERQVIKSQPSKSQSSISHYDVEPISPPQANNNVTTIHQPQNLLLPSTTKWNLPNAKEGQFPYQFATDNPEARRSSLSSQILTSSNLLASNIPGIRSSQTQLGLDISPLDYVNKKIVEVMRTTADESNGEKSKISHDNSQIKNNKLKDEHLAKPPTEQSGENADKSRPSNAESVSTSDVSSNEPTIDQSKAQSSIPKHSNDNNDNKIDSKSQKEIVEGKCSNQITEQDKPSNEITYEQVSQSSEQSNQTLKIEETPKNQDKITSSESVNSNKSTCEVTSASNENASSCDENPSEQQTYKQTYPDSPISPGEMVIDESCSNLTSSTSPSGKVYGHSNPTSPINTSTTQMSQISTTESSDVKEQQKIQSTISSSSTNAEKDCPSQSFSVSSSVCDSEKVNAKSTEENKITNETESEKSSSQVTSSNVSQKIANSDPQSNDSSQTPNNESGSIVSGSGSDTLTNRSSPAAQNVTDETPIVDSNVSESVQPNLTSTVQSSTVSASGQASSTTSSSLPQYEPLSDDE